MTEIKWTKYKKYEGPKCIGDQIFNPPKPWGPWTKIMGVIARCEGNHDTTVMYDGTGVTWGFLQWTFTSGRLQKLLQSFKSIPHYVYDLSDNDGNLFDYVCCNGFDKKQLFENYGFRIQHGKFIDLKRSVALHPYKNRKRINNICINNGLNKPDIEHSKGLASLFVSIGKYPEVQLAQIQFAKNEFERALSYRRKPLDDRTIKDLLPDELWENTVVPAIFFNLWQNSPGGAYKFFLGCWNEARKRQIAVAVGFLRPDMEEVFEEIVWKRLNKTAFANWGWRSKRYKESNGKNKPRIYRIKRAIKEFYNVDFDFIK